MLSAPSHFFSAARSQGRANFLATRCPRTALLILMGCFLFAPAYATPIPKAIDDALNRGETPNVIVAFEVGAIDAAAIGHRRSRSRFDDDRSLAYKEREYRALKSRVLGALPNSDIQTQWDYRHLPMRLIRLRTPGAARALATHREVVGIYEDRKLFPVLAQSLPLIDQPKVAAAGLTGANTAVVVLDSGVNYTLADFGFCTAPGVPAGCRVLVSSDLAPNDGALDDSGHGTHVSAIATAVAPGAKLIMLDVFNGTSAAVSTILQGIDWSISNQATYQIVAINMSLGDGIRYTSPCSSSASNPFVIPVANARAAGITTIAASGNESFIDGMASPACTPGVISVGAVYDANVGGITFPNLCSDSATTADKVACFSDSAGFLTLLAPGALISAAGVTKAGTSQAAPHVTGAVATLRAAYPLDTLDQTLARLTDSGSPVTDTRNGLTFPRINFRGAAAPPNDNFSNATTISADTGQITGTNVLASKQTGEPAHAGNAGGASLFFAWTAPGSGTYVFTTQGSTFDTLLGIYQGASVSSLTVIASNNNDGALGGTSTATFEAIAGQTYYIALDGNNGATGTYTLTWRPGSFESVDVPLLPPWAIVTLLGSLGGVLLRGYRRN